jgi:hypothetical protein
VWGVFFCLIFPFSCRLCCHTFLLGAAGPANHNPSHIFERWQKACLYLSIVIGVCPACVCKCFSAARSLNSQRTRIHGTCFVMPSLCLRFVLICAANIKNGLSWCFCLPACTFSPLHAISRQARPLRPKCGYSSEPRSKFGAIGWRTRSRHICNDGRSSGVTTRSFPSRVYSTALARCSNLVSTWFPLLAGRAGTGLPFFGSTYCNPSHGYARSNYAKQLMW